MAAVDLGKAHGVGYMGCSFGVTACPGVAGSANPYDPCCCECCSGSDSNPAPTSANPIRYSTGDVVLSATDVRTAGYGRSWGHSRSYANRLTFNYNAGNGVNWQIKEWSYLYFATADTIAVMRQANETLWFDRQGDLYVPRYSSREQFVFNSTVNRYQLIELDGTVTEYSSDFGVFVRQTLPGGGVISVVSRASNNFQPTEVQESFTADGITTTDSFVYSYENPFDPVELRLQSVTHRRRIGFGSWTDITRAIYTYYVEGAAYGSAGDLQTATTQVWGGSSWNDTGTSYYRYYLASDGSSSSSSSTSSSSSSVV